MNLIRRLVTIGALFLLPLARIHAQIVERPVPFDANGLVTHFGTNQIGRYPASLAFPLARSASATIQ